MRRRTFLLGAAFAIPAAPALAWTSYSGPKGTPREGLSPAARNAAGIARMSRGYAAGDTNPYDEPITRGGGSSGGRDSRSMGFGGNFGSDGSNNK